MTTPNKALCEAYGLGQGLAPHRVVHQAPVIADQARAGVRGHPARSQQSGDAPAPDYGRLREDFDPSQRISADGTHPRWRVVFHGSS